MSLESDFADGSNVAGLLLAQTYMYSEVQAERERAVSILQCLMPHDRRAHRPLAYCYLYGVGVRRNIEQSRDLLKHM